MEGPRPPVGGEVQEAGEERVVGEVNDHLRRLEMDLLWASLEGRVDDVEGGVSG